MKIYLFLIMFLIIPGLNSEVKPNILFIAIDDLNDWISCMKGHPQVQTPNIDKLAQKGMLFVEAHCAAPLCGPSRASLLSGLAPYQNNIYSNDANYVKHLPNCESLPLRLKKYGYRTLGAGKIFHGPFPKGTFDHFITQPSDKWKEEALLNSNQTPSYTFHYKNKKIIFPRNGIPADRSWTKYHTFDWGPLDLPDHEFKDFRNTEYILETLNSKIKKPFFLAYGLHLPHQPLYAPKRFHDMYPIDQVKLPSYIENDLDDLSIAGLDYALKPYTSGTHNSVHENGQWKSAVSSYLATVSFIDELIGKVTNRLEKSPYVDNTWIILFSDHGWHLGEKQHWGKATGWQRSTRVPLIIVPPEKTAPKGFEAGKVCHAPINLLDLYPTIMDISGVPTPKGLKGKSLIPLLKNPKARWNDHTITTFARGSHAISTKKYRYIHYFDGNAELYDLEKDPNEFNNLIHHPEKKPLIESFKSKLPEEPQWKHFIRYKRFKVVVPSDNSDILLYHLDTNSNIAEKNSEADNYPQIIQHIKNWLKRNPQATKYINLNQQK